MRNWSGAGSGRRLADSMVYIVIEMALKIIEARQSDSVAGVGG